MGKNLKSKEELGQVDAFELVFDEKLEDLKSLGLVFKHKKSGARVIVLSNEDDNKVFSIGFRTPPEDSTGVAHILEHSVLCGSKHFPAKDPFVELVKGSLNTFLNAMTYSDKTIYPVASCNDKDFQNLMHVYLDAVFYPNIYQREEIFKQEGWHYELESEEGELKYNGVVYNEMKGVFSSPEQQLFRVIQQSLFPDTTYGTESGGDPDNIPELTYNQFLDFHKKYYHPSNSYIYLYGDFDVEEKLAWMDANYLSAFEYQSIDSKIQMQPVFDKMREIEADYSVTENESVAEKTYLGYNLVIGTSLDEKLYLAFQILDYVLLSAPGAPLKQALLDAKIGKDILSSYDNGILQPVFSVIAKNTEESKKEEFVNLIHTTLKNIVEKGIDTKALQAAINYFEFKYKEADFGHYPKGLMYGIQILDSWLYDDSKPFIHLKANETFEFMKEQIGSGYYEKLISDYLLHNQHTSLVIVKPQIAMTTKMDQALKQELNEYKAQLSKSDILQLIKQTKGLEEYQETPSTKEELELIPMLAREDIEKKAKPFCNEIKKIDEIQVLHHNIYTNGIGYLKLVFDVGSVPKELIPTLSLLTSVLGYVDTKNYSFLELSNEINIHTGGISSDVNLYSKNAEREEYEAKLEVRTKVLYENIGTALSLIKEMLFSSKLDDEKRLQEIVEELKSRLQMKLNSSGHTVAANRAMSYYSTSAYFNDLIGGLSYYRYMEGLQANFDQEKVELRKNLQELINIIFNKNNVMVSFTADETGYEVLKKEFASFVTCLPNEINNKEKTILEPISLNEGFKTSGKVQYVARAGNFNAEGYHYTGDLRILKVILSYDYLWNNVRVKGGAYGCMCGFSRDGNGFFTSYRDPNLMETNEIYKKAAEYVEKFTVDERDMTKYIIGTISALDTPLSPSAQGSRSFNAYLCGLSEEDVQKERDEVLCAKQENIRALAGIVKAIIDANYICVIGNETKVQEHVALFQKIENLIER